MENPLQKLDLNLLPWNIGLEQESPPIMTTFPQTTFQAELRRIWTRLNPPRKALDYVMYLTYVSAGSPQPHSSRQVASTFDGPPKAKWSPMLLLISLRRYRWTEIHLVEHYMTFHPSEKCK